MGSFILKCDNRSANAVDFGLFLKFRNESQCVVPEKSIICAHKLCNPGTTAEFAWDDALFFVGGQWKKTAGYVFSCSIFREADSGNTGKNTAVLEKENGVYNFEDSTSEIRKNKLYIDSRPSVVNKEYFVGLGMRMRDILIPSIIFEAQSNMHYTFETLVDYYITYAKKYKEGQAVNETDEKNARRFRSNSTIAILKKDNSFVVRKNNE